MQCTNIDIETDITDITVTATVSSSLISSLVSPGGIFACRWIWPAPCSCLDNHLWQRRRGVDYANLLAMNSPWLRLTAWLIFVWGRGGEGMGRRQTPEVFSPWPRPPLIAHRFQTECQGNTIQESLISNKQIKAKTIWCKTILYLDYICNVGEYSPLIGSSIKGKDIIKREAACMGTTPAEAEYYFLQSEY